jgi:hypothetical protein
MKTLAFIKTTNQTTNQLEDIINKKSKPSKEIKKPKFLDRIRRIRKTLIPTLLLPMLLGAGCKPTTHNTDPMTIEYVNSTKGLINRMVYANDGDEEPINIKISDIQSNVDPLRIAIRDNKGDFLKYSNTGNIMVDFYGGKTIKAYVFNKYPGLDYSKFENNKTLMSRRNGTWHPENHRGASGDDNIRDDAMRILNDSLGEFGSWTKVNNGGDRGVGYANLDEGRVGFRTATWFGVNSYYVNGMSRKRIIDTFLEEGGETFGGFVDVRGLTSSTMDRDLLTHVVRFVYAKSDI